MADGIVIKQNPTKIANILKTVQADQGDKSLTVGFYPKSKYITEDTVEYVASVAYDNEYGTTSKDGKPDVPSRPFFQRAVNQMRKEYPALYKKSVPQHKVTEQTLNLIGVEFVNKIRQSIAGEFGEFVPNSPLTVFLKKSDKPLMDTGVLIQSANYQVNDDGN